jgi:tetratricopeptide (TPR) repeat protein
MCNIYGCRWLPSTVALAALAVSPCAPLAQTATVEPVAVAQNSAHALQFQATPEQMGDALVLHQRYQAAIEAYKSGPRNSAVLLNKMGIANQMMLNQSEALHCYQAALKLDPRNAHVLNNMGTLYDAEKRYSDAERMYRRALGVEPKSALIEKNLGTALLAQHKYQKGWDAYQAALAIDPHIFEGDPGLRVDNPATVEERGAMNYYMARGCVRAGMNDRAIEYLRRALTEGFINSKKLVADNEFVSLHGLPAFEQLVGAEQSQ